MANQLKFSLATLAHASRCLFPHDFYKELVEMGVSEDNATILMMIAKTPKALAVAGHSKNILDVYQDVIESASLTAIIEKYLANWESKHNQ